MKNKIITILLTAFMILHAAAPLAELAVNGYPDLISLLSDVYRNGVIVVLSAAVLRLYHHTDAE